MFPIFKSKTNNFTSLRYNLRGSNWREVEEWLAEGKLMELQWQNLLACGTYTEGKLTSFKCH